MHFLGCLFVLIFGAVFIVLAFSNAIIRWIYGFIMYRMFGIKPPQQSAQTHNTSGTNYSGHNTSAGNAHHEGHSSPNSRQQRRGKIFSQDEGTYVDFEEVKKD